MKTVAAIDVDLVTTPLGTSSRQAAELSGVPVLLRTVQRVRRAQEVAEVHLVCPADQVERCRAMLSEEAVTVHGISSGPPPFRRLTRAARSWSLEGWRGGMGGAACMDEYTNAAVLAQLGQQCQADAVWACSGASPLVDADLIDAMIRHFRDHAQHMRMTFAPVPPGLAGTVFATSLLNDLGAENVPPGWALAYKPDEPRMDLAFKECSHPCPQVMRHATGRLIVDTRRAMEHAADILTRHPDPDGPTVCQCLIDRAANHVPSLPREVEIELTTQDPVPDCPLRPRGARVPDRGPIDADLVRRIAAELATYDDSRVVLGGFGEPLGHPQFDAILAALADAGIFAVAVRTAGLTMTEDVIASLVRHKVTVAEFTLDAWTEALYARLHPGAALPTVVSAMDRLAAARAHAGQVEPLVVPSFVKSTDNVHELDAFFDGWIRKEGWAVIHGFSHHAGQLEDRSVVDMSPPHRHPCRRIRNRCTVLADGTLTLCDQDFTGLSKVGSLKHTNLEDLWQSNQFQAARSNQDAGNYQTGPLCANCAEWHRP
ncbi:MAG: SPASM domain-containing protein [Phycisphaerae bacterium]